MAKMGVKLFMKEEYSLNTPFRPKQALYRSVFLRIQHLELNKVAIFAVDKPLS